MGGATSTIRKLKGKEKNSANYTQTLHSALYLFDSPRVAKCIVCALNYTQTIHKLYIEAFKTLHKTAFKTLHSSGAQTLHERERSFTKERT